MTKLYHGADGWTVPGKQDRKAERVDVPNSPEDLADWLNTRGVPPAAPYPGVECVHGYDACPICDATPAPIAPDDAPWVRGPSGPNPPRYATVDQAAADSDVVFVPVDKAAAIAERAGQCPVCHMGQPAAEASLRRAKADEVAQWIAKCDDFASIATIAFAVRDRVAELKIDLTEEGAMQ